MNTKLFDFEAYNLIFSFYLNIKKSTIINSPKEEKNHVK